MLVWSLGAFLAAAPAPVISIGSKVGVNGGAVLPSPFFTGTLTLTPPGTRTSTGGVTLAPSPGWVMGSFTVTGTPGDAFRVSTVGNTPTLIGALHPGNTMSYSNVTFLPATGTLSATPTTIYFGLRVSVQTSGNNPSDTYAGTVSLRVRDTTANLNGVAETFSVKVFATPPAINLTAGANLAFGAVLAGPSPGTVTVTPAGGRSFTGGAGLLGAAGWNAATFTVGGAPYAAFTVSYPSHVTLSPGTTVWVDTFTGGSSTLNAAGSATISMGGTLHLPAGQSPGAYSATFLVTAAYN
jgi:hypothetical protein